MSGVSLAFGKTPDTKPILSALKHTNSQLRAKKREVEEEQKRSEAQERQTGFER